MSEYLSKKMEEEQKAMSRLTNNDLICKNCKNKFNDNKIPGNTSKCSEYKRMKPTKVLLGGKCEKFKKV
jgi:hypothetical protein